LAHAESTSKEIINKFPKVKSVANTFRFDIDDNHLKYFTCFYTDGRSYNSSAFRCACVVDRFKSGDCFMAGLIYGYYYQNQPQDIID
jgi:2-dehydro-3-deoxygluconokinase